MAGVQQEDRAAVRHHLKTQEPYWSQVLEGVKTFEVRRNDRDFRVGDTLDLHRWIGERDTGMSTEVVVTYVLDKEEFGLQPGYVVLGVQGVIV